MKIRIATLLLVLWTGALFAQADLTTIQGTIQNEAGEPLAFANILLHNLPDSSIAKVGYSEENGQFKVFPPDAQQE
ncbi:MAG TPA: carboxypeptidase regulatory-like domain-containing protein [Saprospiraceae bacterium]|nr:carboxypeptidase regulatory-like domain-containing protein [Saprospiraceae bacterium]